MEKKRKSGPSGRPRKLDGPEKEAQAQAIESLAIAAGFCLAQPWIEAATNLIAVSLYAASARRLPDAQMASCNMPTPSLS